MGWHANPVVAQVSVAGGFAVLFPQTENRLTDRKSLPRILRSDFTAV
nr:hypothetical protein BJQ95_02758 [Cryobacterium sp. SO1]